MHEGAHDGTRPSSPTGNDGRHTLGTPVSEEVLIRSYDHQWAYDLEVEIVSADGEPAFHERYYLLPGHTESITGGLPDDEYELRVSLDNDRREVLECRIDASPDHTAVIEVGNGALSLTEGLHA